MIDNITAPCLLIINTNAYAGNFERELCAYLTGHYGECEVGKDFLPLIEQHKELAEFDWVVSIPDEHGCSRPCSIYQDKHEKEYNSVVIFFDGFPNKSIRDHIQKMLKNLENFKEEHKHSNVFRVEHFCKSTFKVLGARYVKRTIKVTDKDLEKITL